MAGEGLLGGEAQLDQGPVLMEDDDANNEVSGMGVMSADKPFMPPPDEQAAEIQTLEEKQIVAGEQMYIISKSWWGDWCAYTQFKQQPADSSSTDADDASTAPPPMEIDNSDIVGANGDLKQDLEENKQFVIVTGQSWELLHSWYGGGPAITRSAVMEGLAPHTKRPRVMLYPMKLEVCWSGKPNEIKTMEAEKTETVRRLKERACAEFGVDPEKTEVWDFFHSSKYANLEAQLDKTLEEARILDENPILLDDKANPLECENKGASSPIVTNTSSRGFGRSSSFMEDSTIQRSDGRPGLVGLQNLGNTCFMNSSLQCLMHSVPIMSVFLSGRYEADLNTSNPLGMQGQLATAFGSLISNLWRNEVGTVVPRGFKAKIAQFAPQFSGYQQHDSQEFLAFLLDGLHEDINRIQVKPYIEEPDSEGTPDEELAARAWANYRARNDSHIVDHFQGLYKSTLVCPKCSYSSVKFDPFMYLSLPLPESRVRQLVAILLHADGSAPPREYGLEVPQTGTVKDLYVALARVAGITLSSPEQQMVAARLSQRYFYTLNVFEDAKTRLSEVVGRDASDGGTLLVYYYSQPEYGPAKEGNHKVLVYHRKAGLKRNDDKFSAPLLMWLPLEQTYDPALHVASSTGSSGAAPAAAPAGGSSSSFNFSSPTTSGGRDQEYIVTEGAPIWGHVRRMMRPFLAVPSLRQRQLVPEAEAAEAAAGDGGEAMQHDQQEEQQPAGSAGPADVSMAAAPSASAMVPGESPTASPSPDGCCTSCSTQQQHDGTAAASCEHTDGDDAHPHPHHATSEGGENNSTWGSHGSDSPRSEMDLGALDYEPQAAAAAAGGGGPPDAGSPLVQSEGELDTNAAFAMEELGTGLQGGAAAAAGAGAGAGLLGAGGVPVQPLDMWAAQAGQAGPTSSPPGSTTEGDAGHTPAAAAAAAAAVAAAAAFSSWPHYQLKLARDTGDYSTVVTPWYSAHFHPNAHHNTFVLDWDLRSAYNVPYQEYAVAAAAEAASNQQQQQQEGSSSLQQQAGPDQQVQDQLEQQQTDGGSSSSHFWLPDCTTLTVDGTAMQPPLALDICGDYVLQPLQQPEFDASTLPIRAARQDPRGKSVGLECCVEAFLQPEQLSEADEWYCPKCKEHVQADKKLDLWSLPEVLVVHLKRFSYTRWNRDKLDTQVLFPLIGLDLSRYVLQCQEQPPIYDCYAVSNHYGGLGGGHYTAFAQMPNDKQWYCFDDSRVEEISPEGVQSRAAYVLFYRRRQQVQADPPQLVDNLLQQRQQHLDAKRQHQQREQEEAAAAAAAAAAATATLPGPPAAAMDEDTPLVFPVGAAGAGAGSSPAAEWGSPSPGANAVAGNNGAAGSLEVPDTNFTLYSPVGGAGTDATMGTSPPASPVTVLPRSVGGGMGAARGGAAPDTTSTSTSSHGGVRGGEEDNGDSSDGSSSSRAGRGRRQRQQQQQQQGGSSSWDAAANAQELGALQVVPPAQQSMEEGAAAAAGRSARPSDQDLDADMADRDV